MSVTPAARGRVDAKLYADINPGDVYSPRCIECLAPQFCSIRKMGASFCLGRLMGQ
ncbi:hypothetical protein PXW05_10315 [Serratia marcescens]|nr:hypothetical protein [Serratia marcescens]WEE06778.1 hypothetical protein PXW05_10315 [Serratia marcescens]